MDDAQRRLQSHLDEMRLEFTPDRHFVRWSASNRRHPRNWPMVRKVYDSSLIIWLDLFTTAVSTAGSSAANSAQQEFGTEPTLSIFIFVSIYLLGQGLGGIIFPPYSEAFGRKKLYIISTGLYSIFCVLVAVVPSLGRIEDMFNAKDRIWLIFLWAMVSNMGLITGPIMSTYITAALGWRWVFYVAAIVLGITTSLLFGLRESRPSLLLVREVARLRQTTGMDDLHALNPDHTPDLRTFVRLALFRPVHLFFTEPIVFMVSPYPPIYESFNFSAESASLPFLAIGIGLIAGILTRVCDNRILQNHRRDGHPLTPEHKLLGFTIGAPILAGALWWFAWTIPPHVQHLHWLVSTVALVFIGYALNEFDTVLAGYLADSYLSYAASGFAALALLRSCISAAFPLFASQMFRGLSANVAVSVLAALATLFCVVPRLFTQYGERIRARSKFAKHSLQVYHDNGVDKNGY
ncbi:putative MFS transporter [Talaromyces proteolyticus]|uniref:MFS transporter n=1 Tax=Talaromyces proteolyticus TaxID=1131652 RepID=A0AAD4Q313_9EURO|nr:putative MFS transporter [Talaromyces proteolyticus]KAH8700928.1 putative MFS transporter [Talaromyces proteolyticus]